MEKQIFEVKIVIESKSVDSVISMIKRIIEDSRTISFDIRRK